MKKSLFVLPLLLTSLLASCGGEKGIDVEMSSSGTFYRYGESTLTISTGTNDAKFKKDLKKEYILNTEVFAGKQVKEFTYVNDTTAKIILNGEVTGEKADGIVGNFEISADAISWSGTSIVKKYIVKDAYFATDKATTVDSGSLGNSVYGKFKLEGATLNLTKDISGTVSTLKNDFKINNFQDYCTVNIKKEADGKLYVDFAVDGEMSFLIDSSKDGTITIPSSFFDNGHSLTIAFKYDPDFQVPLIAKDTKFLFA